MAMEVMIDLETMGVRSDAAIVSIGAVMFDPRAAPGTLGNPADPDYDHFYMNVELASCIDAGLTVDGATVAFWMMQPDVVRQQLMQSVQFPPEPLEHALSQLHIWFGMNSLPTWGNGSAFDCVILRNAYLKTGRQPPFKFHHERCYRTTRAMFPQVERVASATPHHALHDAIAQAVHLQAIFHHHIG